MVKPPNYRKNIWNWTVYEHVVLNWHTSDVYELLKKDKNMLAQDFFRKCGDTLMPTVLCRVFFMALWRYDSNIVPYLYKNHALFKNADRCTNGHAIDPYCFAKNVVLFAVATFKEHKRYYHDLLDNSCVGVKELQKSIHNYELYSETKKRMSAEANIEESADVAQEWLKAEQDLQKIREQKVDEIMCRHCWQKIAKECCLDRTYEVDSKKVKNMCATDATAEKIQAKIQGDDTITIEDVLNAECEVLVPYHLVCKTKFLKSLMNEDSNV
jgi:hypothetical protein